MFDYDRMSVLILQSFYMEAFIDPPSFQSFCCFQPIFMAFFMEMNVGRLFLYIQKLNMASFMQYILKKQIQKQQKKIKENSSSKIIDIDFLHYLKRKDEPNKSRQSQQNLKNLLSLMKQVDIYLDNPSIIIFNTKTQQMQSQQIDQLFYNINQSNPKQLRQVIDILINKTRLLIQNLQATWQKLEQIQIQKTFWKDSYYSLRESCQKYIDKKGIVPFNYILALQLQLKKQKISKSCLEQKFKVMQPQSLNETMKYKKLQKEQARGNNDNELLKTYGTNHNDHNGSASLKESTKIVKLQNKNKIGPKSIEFFKFRQSKLQQQ